MALREAGAFSYGLVFLILRPWRPINTNQTGGCREPGFPAEGPRKWYITACPSGVAKGYLPAEASGLDAETGCNRPIARASQYEGKWEGRRAILGRSPAKTPHLASTSFSAASTNLVSSAFAPGLPARWPQIDSMGRSSEFGISETSYALSSGGK